MDSVSERTQRAIPKAFWSGVAVGTLAGSLGALILYGAIRPSFAYSCNFENQKHCVSTWTSNQHLVAIDQNGDHRADVLVLDGEPRTRNEMTTPDLEAKAREADDLLARCPCTKTY